MKMHNLVETCEKRIKNDFYTPKYVCYANRETAESRGDAAGEDLKRRIA